MYMRDVWTKGRLLTVEEILMTENRELMKRPAKITRGKKWKIQTTEELEGNKDSK